MKEEIFTNEKIKINSFDKKISIHTEKVTKKKVVHGFQTKDLEKNKCATKSG